ncbi:NUDIX HYDROLASE 14 CHLOROPLASTIC [Salix viminalis]|uniref:NUDIX HYDROLASE 14 CHLOROPLASTIC n=1 Tax=Salix viminalis TaxID=40686 RepID=A0A9Q0QC51_SALVM|nr:NUDIX HYDROLASE 14 CHLOROPLASTIC [Salix viminalis]
MKGLYRLQYVHFRDFRRSSELLEGCDEEISVFLYRGCVGKEIITQLQGKETGLREAGELIKVHVVPYKKLWRITADAKVLMAIALYEMAKGSGLLPLKT